MRYVFAFAPFPFSIIFYLLRGYLALPLMACCFLSQIFQYGQCLRSFCAPSSGMLQEVFSSFDNSLPKERKYESDTKLDNLTNNKTAPPRSQQQRQQQLRHRRVPQAAAAEARGARQQLEVAGQHAERSVQLLTLLPSGIAIWN